MPAPATTPTPIEDDKVLKRRVDAWVRIIDCAPLLAALVDNGTALAHAQADLARSLFLSQNALLREWSPEHRARTRIMDAAYARLRLAFHDARMAAEAAKRAQAEKDFAIARAEASAFTVLAAIAAKPSPRAPIRQASHS